MSLSYRIAPLPDFLEDHSLLGEKPAERISEAAARWVQLLTSLWKWHDRASFCLRYIAEAGKIETWLLATAFETSEAKSLQGEVEVILKSRRILMNPAPAAPPTIAQGVHIEELRQREVGKLWTPKQMLIQANLAHLTEETARAPVIFPWWGAGGPFLLPMESLLAQETLAELSIYLQPTCLREWERDWLQAMASDAMSQSQGTDGGGLGKTSSLGGRSNPTAAMAARLYSENLRRLAAYPFLVAVHCAANSAEAARSLSGAMESLPFEIPFERQYVSEEALPSGTERRSIVDLAQKPADAAAVRRLREELRFPDEFGRSEEKPERANNAGLAGVVKLRRLPYLVDPQGAATMFRLPISVRGGVAGMKVKQLSPSFVPGPRQDKPEDGGKFLELGRYHTGGKSYVRLDDLTKHVLVTGFTGSGKSVTVMQILHQLWEHEVPFLVLESAKQEYRGMLGVGAFKEDARVYTLGNERCVPFRINPFELLPGVRVEAHIAKLQTCFEAAIPPIGPSSSVISSALLRTYHEAGWRLTDIYPKEEPWPRRTFPGLQNFVACVEKVLAERDYKGDVADNMKAALVGRFQPLLTGSKGAMFSSERSSPAPEELFSKPTILEMNDLNIDDKALMSMFILTMLREHREIEKTTDGTLLHVTVVEEAHNVLEDVGSVGGGEGNGAADTRYKAVQAFCALLTEIRSLGEGLMIADQSPCKLARDAIRNTNIQIAHQLRDATDRAAIAEAMIMEGEQRDFIGKLPVGQAALFRTGLEKATFVTFSKYYPSHPGDEPPEGGFKGLGFNPLLRDEDVEGHMRRVAGSALEKRRLDLPFAGCRQCQSQCVYLDRMFPWSAEPLLQERLRKEWHEPSAPAEITGEMERAIWKLKKGGSWAKGVVAERHADSSWDASWCLFLNSLARRPTAAAGLGSMDARHRAAFESGG